MICKIGGEIQGFTARGVEIKYAGLSFEAWLTSYDRQVVAALGPNSHLELYTIFYLEGNVAAGNLVPRLLGFRSQEDREFFECFTAVKGLGVGRALTALNLPPHRVAAAIEAGDTALLASLKGIGPRTAAQVVAALKGKVGRFVPLGKHEGRLGIGKVTAGEEAEQLGSLASEALAESEQVLAQLGYRSSEARVMLARAYTRLGPGATAEELISEVYRVEPKSDEGP